MFLGNDGDSYMDEVEFNTDKLDYYTAVPWSWCLDHQYAQEIYLNCKNIYVMM